MDVGDGAVEDADGHELEVVPLTEFGHEPISPSEQHRVHVQAVVVDQIVRRSACVPCPHRRRRPDRSPTVCLSSLIVVTGSALTVVFQSAASDVLLNTVLGIGTQIPHTRS